MINLSEYQELASRTCVVKDREFNRQHMILGVVSEVGELADAYKKHIAYGKELDRVNVLEEWADVMFYVVNWCRMNNYVTSEYKFKELNLLATDLESGKSNPPTSIIFNYLLVLRFHCPDLLNNTMSLGICLGFTEEELFKALENNINKLKVRYPDSFSQENALNRDLESERKELEK